MTSARLEIIAAAALAAAGAYSGCAAVAVSGAVSGVEYTFTNVAYRTFTFPHGKVHAAALAALKKMGIVVLNDEKIAAGTRLKAKTEKLAISVKLESVTRKATKMSVDVKRNLVMKDKPLAVEIITQTGRLLGEK